MYKSKYFPAIIPIMLLAIIIVSPVFPQDGLTADTENDTSESDTEGYYPESSTVRENFHPWGIVLDIDGSFFVDTENDYFEFETDIEVSTYIIEWLSIGPGLGIDYDSDKDDLHFSLRIPVHYTIPLMDEDAEKGLTLQLRLTTGIYNIGSYLNDISIYLWPYFRFNYFVSPRVALYLEPSFIRLNLSPDASDRVRSYFNLDFGISFYRPDKDKSIKTIMNYFNN